MLNQINPNRQRFFLSTKILFFNWANVISVIKDGTVQVRLITLVKNFSRELNQTVFEGEQ